MLDHRLETNYSRDVGLRKANPLQSLQQREILESTVDAVSTA
jgi:hypothetical protein